MLNELIYIHLNKMLNELIYIHLNKMLNELIYFHLNKLLYFDIAKSAYLYDTKTTTVSSKQLVNWKNTLLTEVVTQLSYKCKVWVLCWSDLTMYLLSATDK